MNFNGRQPKEELRLSSELRYGLYHKVRKKKTFLVPLFLVWLLFLIKSFPLITIQVIRVLAFHQFYCFCKYIQVIQLSSQFFYEIVTFPIFTLFEFSRLSFFLTSVSMMEKVVYYLFLFPFVSKTLTRKTIHDLHSNFKLHPLDSFISVFVTRIPFFSSTLHLCFCSFTQSSLKNFQGFPST